VVGLPAKMPGLSRKLVDQFLTHKLFQTVGLPPGHGDAWGKLMKQGYLVHVCPGYLA